MNKAPDSAEREPSVTATESLAEPQNEQTLKPSSHSRLLMEDSQKLAPSQAGNLETRPEGGTAPANSGLAPAGGNGELDASHLASFGLESAPPAFTPVPPSTPAILEPSQVIRPDGTPIATAPSAPASTASAPPLAGMPKPAVPSAAPQTVRPDRAPIARRRPLPLRPLQRRLWLRRRSRRALGSPANGEVECGANCDGAAHSRFDRLSAASGRDAKAEGQADSVCVERISRSPRRRRSIQGRNRPRNHPCKSLARAQKPRQNQLLRLSHRPSWRHRKKRRARPIPRKTPAVRLRWRRLQDVGSAAGRRWNDARIRLPDTLAGRARSTLRRHKRRCSLRMTQFHTEPCARDPWRGLEQGRDVHPSPSGHLVNRKMSAPDLGKRSGDRSDP